MVNKVNDQDTAQKELLRLQNEIDVLKSTQESSLTDQQRIDQLANSKVKIVSKKNLIDRAYEKKGFFHYWYVKMPLKNLNIASIAQTQNSINSSVKGVISPQCPKCSRGVLMYSKSEIYTDGTVDWFCGNETCDYTINAKSSMRGFYELSTNAELHSNVLNEGRERLAKLTEEQKAELIKDHLFKAKIYACGTMFFVLMFILQIFIGVWFGLILTLPVILITQLLSIKFCFRAWQIKTGNAFLPKSPFFQWLKTARHFYSLEWVDEPTQITK